MTTAWRDSAADIVRLLGPDRLRAVADGLAAGHGVGSLCAAHPVPGAGQAITALHAAVDPESRPEAAVYLRGLADGWAERTGLEHVESVWSGPGSHEVPVRSTAQVLVDVVTRASRELLLMTYSAKPYPPVVDALRAARARGVRTTVVVETILGAGGAITGSEPAQAFRSVPGVELWHWPPTKRTDPKAKMHAKIAVADRRVLLTTSANLTQSGAGANLEAGLLVRGGSAPARAAEHVDQLIATGTLARLLPDD